MDNVRKQAHPYTPTCPPTHTWPSASEVLQHDSLGGRRILLSPGAALHPTIRTLLPCRRVESDRDNGEIFILIEAPSLGTGRARVASVRVLLHLCEGRRQNDRVSSLYQLSTRKGKRRLPFPCRPFLLPARAYIHTHPIHPPAHHILLRSIHFSLVLPSLCSVLRAYAHHMRTQTDNRQCQYKKHMQTTNLGLDCSPDHEEAGRVHELHEVWGPGQTDLFDPRVRNGEDHPRQTPEAPPGRAREEHTLHTRELHLWEKGRARECEKERVLCTYICVGVPVWCVYVYVYVCTVRIIPGRPPRHRHDVCEKNLRSTRRSGKRSCAKESLQAAKAHGGDL